jgi:hypothetical protein
MRFLDAYIHVRCLLTRFLTVRCLLSRFVRCLHTRFLRVRCLLTRFLICQRACESVFLFAQAPLARELAAATATDHFHLMMLVLVAGQVRMPQHGSDERSSGSGQIPV